MSRAVRELPALVLLAVAIGQIALTRSDRLTAWKGGGFGMFATLDHAPFRGVDIVVEAVDRSETLDVPRSLEALAARAVAYPSHRVLERFAHAVAARERRNGRAVETVTLRIWGCDFDRHSLHPSERDLRTATFRIP